MNIRTMIKCRRKGFANAVYNEDVSRYSQIKDEDVLDYFG